MAGRDGRWKMGESDGVLECIDGLGMETVCLIDVAIRQRIGFGDKMYSVPPGCWGVLTPEVPERSRRFGTTRIHSDR